MVVEKEGVGAVQGVVEAAQEAAEAVDALEVEVPAEGGNALHCHIWLH